MHVSLHRGIRDPALVSRLWVIYERGYAKVAAASVVHEMLSRPEFEECIHDATNRTWLIWDDGVPVGMAVIATDVAATAWLSTGYFADRHPDRLREQRVHYLLFTVIDKPYVGGTALYRLARPLLEMEASEGALLVFDVPEVNQPTERGGLAEVMRRLAKMIAPSEVAQIEVQRYFSVDFVAPEVDTSVDATAPVLDEVASGGERRSPS